MLDNLLPDELISEILSPALKIPDELFSDTKNISPFATYGESTSAYLLVCKSWLRVATPLLYNVVVLRSKAQAKALATALSANSQLGHFIKKLRVEGGFGPPMQNILRCSPNVTDLFLTLDIYSSDNTGGLCRGLSLVNPSRFILHQDSRHKPLDNKAVSQLLATLSKCVVKWTNLVVFHCPFVEHSPPFQQALLPAVTTKPLHTLSIPSIPALSWAYHTFKACPLKTILIKDPLTFWDRSDIPEHDPILMSLLKFTKHPTQFDPRALRDGVTTDLPLIAPSLNPFFVPMANAPKPVQDKIWSHILSLAMPPRKLRFLLVSKTFHRLALPHYYTHIVIRRSEDLPQLASILMRQPTLCSHIRGLTLSWYGWSEFRPDNSLESPPEGQLSRTESIFAILSRTINLSHFGNTRRATDISVTFSDLDREPLISWEAFETLARCSGSTLHHFSSPVFTRQHATATTFENLKALRILVWSCVTAISNVENVSDAALPNLEELRILYSDPSFLSVLSKMKLSSLKRAVLGDRYHANVETFLQTHGPKLSVICISHGTFSVIGVKLFDLCPNMALLTLWSRFEIFAPSFKNLHPSRKVPSLLKIAFDGEYNLGKVKDSEWDIFFANFKPQYLAGLRELQFKCLKWPTTERDIAKCSWVRWAEIMLAHGVHLIDSSGTKWRPRLKVK
ncbi:F-box domain-containing protein [Favolaschia claudopus]|uniref:F-box domain-containing protein n=1 Tax=Favolaschia claudopus TaxID=2862362 RepID=A0AAW0AQ24_9AGAR